MLLSPIVCSTLPWFIPVRILYHKTNLEVQTLAERSTSTFCSLCLGQLLRLYLHAFPLFSRAVQYHLSHWLSSCPRQGTSSTCTLPIYYGPPFWMWFSIGDYSTNVSLTHPMQTGKYFSSFGKSRTLSLRLPNKEMRGTISLNEQVRKWVLSTVNHRWCHKERWMRDEGDSRLVDGVWTCATKNRWLINYEQYWAITKDNIGHEIRRDIFCGLSSRWFGMVLFSFRWIAGNSWEFFETFNK